MSGPRVGSLLLAVAVTGAACASTAGGGNRFVRSGGPGFVDVGGALPLSAEAAKEEVARAEREARAARAAVPKQSLTVVETANPELGEALALLGKAPSAASHLEVARQYQRLGVRDFAYDHYSDALEYDPRNVTALDARARIWRDWGFQGPALADVHRARYFHPASAEVHNTLGTILERRGLCREALTAYREALRLKPEAAWASQNVTRLEENCVGKP